MVNCHENLHFCCKVSIFYDRDCRSENESPNWLGENQKNKIRVTFKNLKIRKVLGSPGFWPVVTDQLPDSDLRPKILSFKSSVSLMNLRAESSDICTRF